MATIHEPERNYESTQYNPRTVLVMVICDDGGDDGGGEGGDGAEGGDGGDDGGGDDGGGDDVDTKSTLQGPQTATKSTRQGPQSIASATKSAPQNPPSIAPATKSALQGPQNTAPPAKSTRKGPQTAAPATMLQGSQSVAPATKSALSGPKYCACHEVCTSRFPSQTQHLNEPHVQKSRLTAPATKSEQAQTNTMSKVLCLPDLLHLSQKVDFRPPKHEVSLAPATKRARATTRAQSRRAPSPAHQILRACAVEMLFDISRWMNVL